MLRKQLALYMAQHGPGPVTQQGGELPGTRLHSGKACSHGHYCKGTHWLWVIAGRGAALPTPSREPHSRARRGCGRPGRRRCHRLGWGAPQRPGERGSGACAPCAACSSPGSPPCRRAPPGALSPAERLIAGGLTGAMPGAFARMPARAPTLLTKAAVTACLARALSSPAAAGVRALAQRAQAGACGPAPGELARHGRPQEGGRRLRGEVGVPAHEHMEVGP